MKVKTKHLKIISDIHTPVGVYLKLRDLYSKVFLLESSDYKGSENSLSFICFDSKAQISIYDDICLLYTSPSQRDRTRSRMPSSA